MDEGMTTNGPNANDAARPQPEGDWLPCPQGEVGQLVGRLRTRKRNLQIRRVTQLSLVATGVFAVAVSWFAFAPAPAPAKPAPIQAQTVASITCGEVRQRATEFVNGRVDGEMKARIEKHLHKCGSCAKFVKEHRPTAILTK
jgi:hypothetical protein